MAKIFFVGLDGTEKSYRLQTHRPFTVGRDPGNDIILRDPKVSRHHAEIVFERGFFVLHDLASANGTYVNGKRVRVAPLTHGAKLRMGNSYGRFSEELPTETDQPHADTGAPVAAQVDVENAQTAAHDRVAVDTMPHEKVGDDLKKK
ncbi:MAG TPA: FHA domain-containing protein [Thermoanaerobaculia bacterium]|nr:FHA domain-containing protein [Thermoanaerobaculia bacterium]